MSATILGDPIRGGTITIRAIGSATTIDPRRAAALEDQVRAAAREIPWAPQDPQVSAVLVDHRASREITLRVPDGVRAGAVRERMAAAESVRCGCGARGSWDHRVSGSSESDAVVWAGCPYHSGTALGTPIRKTDLEWYERFAGRA